MVNEVSIKDIVIGKRHRKHMGDVRSLVTSIEAIGLLQPIVVTPDNKLIAGCRRIEAFKHLGREKIPVRVLALDELVYGECAENMERMDFTPSECWAIGEAVAEKHRKAAKNSKVEAGKVHGKGQIGSPKLREPKHARESNTLTAKTVGLSGTTYQRIGEIVEAAKAEPERFGPLLDKMNRTGRVAGMYKQLKVARQSEAIEAEAPPLPAGPFRVIVADPPWRYDNRVEDPSHRNALPYASMSIDDIKGFLPAGLAHDDCVLWLWTTNAHMDEAFDVARAWGFNPKTILTWVKQKMGTGDWLRGKTEHCLMCIKGKPTIRLTNQTTVLMADAGKHSAKPDEFYAMVDELCPGSKVELFQRASRDGYIGAGLEANWRPLDKSGRLLSA